MGNKIFAMTVAVLALAVSAAPAGAQQASAGYSFLKGVKDRDAGKVTTALAGPGTVIVNSRERDTGDGALHHIVRGRDLTWLGFLLGKGARPDLSNNQGDAPLALAARIGWVEGAQLLLRRGASVDHVNAKGETALIVAVQNRDIAMTRLLLAQGANPKRTDSVAGYSALDYAKRDPRAASLVKLLEAAPAKPKAVAGPTL